MAIKYMLDTNICIYIAKQKPISVLEKFQDLAIGEATISTITYGEMIYGAQKSQQKEKSMSIINKLANIIPPLPMPTEAGKHYGELRRELEKKGTPVGNNDLWIAAHALSLDLTLITNNLKEFSRIKHLKSANWI